MYGVASIWQGEDGIPEVIACLNAYNFTRDDWESIIELSHYNGSPDVLKRIPAKVFDGGVGGRGKWEEWTGEFRWREGSLRPVFVFNLILLTSFY